MNKESKHTEVDTLLSEIKRREQEIYYLRRQLQGEKNISKQLELELRDALSTVEAQQRLIDFSAMELKESREEIKAHEALEKLFVSEKESAQKIIEALEQVEILRKNEKDNAETLNYAFETLSESFRQELIDKNSYLNKIFHFSHGLSSSLDRDIILRKLIEFLVQSLQLERAVLYLMKGDDLILYKTYQINTEELAAYQEIQQVAEKVARQKITLLENDPGKKVNYLVVPLLFKDEILGVFYGEKSGLENTVQEEDFRLAEIFCTQAAISLKNSSLLRSLEEGIRKNAEEVREKADDFNTHLKLFEKLQDDIFSKVSSLDDYEIISNIKYADAQKGIFLEKFSFQDRAWLIIGEIGAPGLIAVLLRLQLQFLIQKTISEYPNDGPGKLLSRVDRQLFSIIKKDENLSYKTSAVLVDQGKGRFAFAGLHHGVVVYRKRTNSLEMPEAEGVWIALLDEYREYITVKSFQLDKDDSALIYTEAFLERDDSDEQRMDEIKDIFIKCIGEDSENLYSCMDNLHEDFSFLLVRKGG